MATDPGIRTGTTTAASPAPVCPELHFDQRTELGEFLRSRRARLKPADVGLREYNRRRRVPGLRREELAQVAGVSAAYYTRLEQGNGQNVSNEVLDAISSALGLSEAEHAHLVHLARPPRRKQGVELRRQQVRPELLEMLSALDSVPAYVWGRRSDVLAWNRLACVLFGDWNARAPRDRNWGRVAFLEPRARQRFADWEAKAADVVGHLRWYAGRHPNDPQLGELLADLSVSADFRRMWDAHQVKRKTHGRMRINHPAVGELTVCYETFTLPGDEDQSLAIYHAEAGTSSEEALRSLTLSRELTAGVRD
ncbi:MULTISPECIES: helix-turn-helix transcriptional regulator [unclassified Amycolatopsis]|uniref:helix-turn-helix transcriptional regulator n=1 Tax=unclassified Amycolatopsis TaxID=2618356 RepID=UPI001C69C6F8|nr:helix-turn-helix transcriptional regulator [Amycolatopsis sp. DSM 110486]QYN20218.1 helix-turn-helix transcriptional regulator [Amycolatopsis sp. DSM 110486]